MNTNPSLPQTNKALSFIKSKKGIIIIGSTVVIITVIIIIVATTSSSSTSPSPSPSSSSSSDICETGIKEKCLTCDQNNRKICGSCNEYYDLIDGKCNEIKYTIRGVYTIMESNIVKFINQKYIEDVESLRIDDKVLEKPIYEYTESSFVERKYYHVYIVLKDKTYDSFAGMFENTDILKVEFNPNFETKSLVDTSSMFKKSLLNEIKLGNIDTSEVTNMDSMFEQTAIEDTSFFSKLKFGKVKNMNNMFHLSAIKTFNSQNLDLPHLETMENFFSQSIFLYSVELSKMNAPELKNMNGMFESCSGLKYLGLKDMNIPKLESIKKMFYYSEVPKDFVLSVFKSNNIKDISSLFQRCTGLTSINFDGFFTKKVEDMSYLFSYSSIKQFNLNNIDTSQVTNMERMFEYTKASEIDVSMFNTGNVENMNSMFEYAEIINLDLKNFIFSSNVKAFNMLYGCTKLISLDISSLIYTNEDMGHYFSNNANKGKICVHKSFENHLGSYFENWEIEYKE
jgi:surface protein